MPQLNYYENEKAVFKEEFGHFYFKKLTDSEIKYVFKKLKTKYKFWHNFEFYGYEYSRSICSSRYVRMIHNASVGSLAHEVAHAIQYMKRRKQCPDWKDGKIKKKRWHTKEHLNITRRVLKYMWKHLDDWLEAENQRHERSLETKERQKEAILKAKTEKNSPNYKLKAIQDRIKKWETKKKRSENALKKLRRREKIWQKKALEPPKPQKEKKKYLTPKQKAMELVNKMGCKAIVHRGDSFCEGTINIEPPEGYSLDELRLGFVCSDWKDVYERLSHAELRKLATVEIEYGGN